MLWALLLWATGCKSPQPGGETNPNRRFVAKVAKPQRAPARTSPARPSRPTVQAIVESRGRIVVVRPLSRFVVIDFGIDNLPPLGQEMAVYRNGVRVGTVRISGPSMGSMIVADVLAGDARVGDEVRPEEPSSP